MPALQSGTFSKWARARGLSSSSPSTQEALTAPTQTSVASASQGGQASTSSPEKAMRGAGGPRDPRGRRYVLVWADSFSQTLDDTGARSIVELLEANGFAVIVAPDVCCGLTWITTGQLSGAKKKLSALLDALAPFAANGIPILGVEPSCTAVLRDDVLDLLPEDPRSSLLARGTFTLSELLATVPDEDLNLPDLSGVEIVAQPHCHHYSVMGWSADRALLDRLGATVTQLSGCCGLAGNFGMEKGRGVREGCGEVFVAHPR